MRVTNSMMYANILSNVTKNMENYQRLNEINSSEKRITTPSDDPTGSAVAASQHTYESAYSQYIKNLKEAQEYLKATDSALQSLNDILDTAKEYAETNAAETANSGNREVAAEQVGLLIDQALEVANTQVKDRYIFSGQNANQKTYSEVGRILSPYAASSNTYTGTVTADGSFKGKSNLEYAIKIVQDGNIGFSGAATTAKYQISTDGGTTWGETKDFDSKQIDLPLADGTDSGVDVHFTAGDFKSGDQFKVTIAAGKFQGDSGSIDYHANINTTIRTNVTAQEAMEDNGYLDTLYKLKSALENGNVNEISQSVSSLKTLQDNMQNEVVRAGVYQNRAEIAQSNLTSLQENVLSSIQDIEKVDQVEALTNFTMAENALNSSVSALAKIFPASLLNYL